MDAILIPILALVPIALVKIGIAIKALGLIMLANPLTALAVGFVALLTTVYIFRNEFVHVFNILTQKTLPIVGLKIKLFAKKMYSSFHDFLFNTFKTGYGICYRWHFNQSKYSNRRC